MSALAKLERARTDLAEARTLEEVKQIRDLAEAARTYAKAATPWAVRRLIYARQATFRSGRQAP